MRQCLYTLIDKNFNLDPTSQALLMGVLMLACAIVGYLLGSINPAILISKLIYRDDIRRHGSGNAGTTNMLRTYGKKAALMTFAGDTLKCFAAVIIGSLLVLDGDYIAGLFCVIGHVFPIFYKFKGGKGVAATATVMLFTSPIVFLIELIVFAGILLSTKYMSLASIMCALLYPVFLSSWNSAQSSVAKMTALGPLLAVLMAVLVVVMHKDNIARLLNKTEPKTDLFAKKKNKKKDDKEDKDE